MRRAAVFGASGGLASALIDEMMARGWHVDAVCRAASASKMATRSSSGVRGQRVRMLTVDDRYANFVFSESYETVFFTQAVFDPKPIAQVTKDAIATEVMVGLTEIMMLTRDFLDTFPPQTGIRRDICFVGSTSAYAGFKNTTVYCAVKHGLLGFVRALNDEYARTDYRFWLFSMGTMRTTMGERVSGQDSSTFLEPRSVAARMVDAVACPENLFEPEIVIRRRVVR